LDEISVLESVRSGNADAFAEVIEKYQVPITRYLYRLTGDWEIAKDLAQDTFIQAYKSALKTRFHSSFKSWLYKTATNNSNQYFRKHKPKKVVSLEVTNVETNSNTKDCTNSIIESLTINETLLRLDKDKRICLLLHFWEGLKYREIAEITGITEEAVRKRVTRGCQDFKKQYQLETGESR
jgi:RNA polymerase sigma-70 factor (ECF subfamily)